MIAGAAATTPGVLDDAGLRRAVTVLAITVTASYGVLYYAFPVLLGSISADTGWSPAQATAAFSLGQVVAGVSGIVVGRQIDRRGPHVIMTVGSALAAAAVALVASAHSYGQFLAAWGIAGLAMSAVFYGPAFAALTHWGGHRKVRAITTVTLVAGLASTIFAPLTAAVDDWLTWRQAYLVLAALLAATTVPLHWLGLDRPWHPGHEARPSGAGAHSGGVAGQRPFILLAVAFSLASFAVYAALVGLVPLLASRGLTAGQAAAGLALGGLGQVAGRLGYRLIESRTSPVSRASALLGAVAAFTGLLALLPGPAFVLLAVSTLLGTARGLLTLVEATAVSDRWGVDGFGRLNGILSAPMMLAAAVAPFAGAAIGSMTGSDGSAFLVFAAVSALAAAIALGTRPTPIRPQRRALAEAAAT